KGAYSMVLMSSQKLIACRDPLGVRPLCIGVIDNAAGGASYVVASESCALDAVGAHFLQDVQPGEIIVIDQDGMRTLKSGPAPKKCMCVFEYIYFARPDSVIDGNSVNISRESAGKILAQTYRVNADVVIGVPDSGLDAAVGYARESGIPYAIGLIKNKYIGRTFIQPYQKDRATGVRIKLNPVPSVVKGKRVIMVDDSIVRGTTMARIVGLLREAGAVQVHVMSSAPEFKHLCYFGTDIDARENLIANQYDTYEEIAAAIGADSVGFLPVRELTKLVRPKQGICDACFTGEYPIEIPAEPCKIKIKYEEKLPG
ncbi:MAG: amidophosphoribosyltransferase, partial [Oscillospiraceae bacterium]|nr:amidophosphoribosyltransferase [Oscillospiraceae bacterium]